MAPTACASEKSPAFFYLSSAYKRARLEWHFRRCSQIQSGSRSALQSAEPLHPTPGSHLGLSPRVVAGGGCTLHFMDMDTLDTQSVYPTCTLKLICLTITVVITITINRPFPELLNSTTSNSKLIPPPWISNVPNLNAGNSRFILLK